MTRPEDFSRVMSLQYAAPPAAEPQEGELDLTGIFRIVRRRIWLISGIIVLISLSALGPILSMQPSYVARSRVLIQPAPTAAFAGPDRPRDPTLNLSTEVERLLSRDTAVQVIRQLSLNTRAEFNPDLGRPSLLSRMTQKAVGFIHRLRLADAGGSAAIRDPIQQVVRSYFDALQVRREPDSNVIEIGFTSRDPALAAEVPNTLLRVYLEARRNDRARMNATADQWLQDRITDQDGRVVDAERALRIFAATGGLAAGELLAGSFKMIADLDGQLTDLVPSRNQLVAMEATLKAAPMDGKIAMVDTPAVAELSGQLQLQRHELERLLLVYGGSSRLVVAARAKVQDTSAAIAIEIGRFEKAIGPRIDAINRDEANIRSALSAIDAKILEQEDAASQRRTLEKAVSDEQQMLTTLKDQQRALAGESQLPTAEVEVLLPATEPFHPTGRGRTFFFTLVVAAAALTGLTVAALVEVLDGSVRSPRQLRRAFGSLPSVLVPRFPDPVVRELPGIIARRRDSSLADTFRGLVLGLQRANGGRTPESIMVTSPLPGDGKSLLAGALAVELVALRRVLLVDCDLRRGTVHSLFGSSIGPGIGDVLRGQSELADVVRTDEASGVAFVTRGARCGKPLDQATLASILGYARAQGMIVIIDTPPSLASVSATVLADYVEATVLVLRWGRTSRRCAETAVERLQNSQPKPTVLVVNMVDPRRHALYGFGDTPPFSMQLMRYMASP